MASQILRRPADLLRLFEGVSSASASELARLCVEHEEREVYPRERLAAGESIVGVYPPSEDVLRQFRERRAPRGHEDGP